MRYIIPILICVWIFSVDAKCMATEPVTSNDSTLAIVNGEAIYVSELVDELMQLHQGQEETHRSDFDVDRLLTKLINDRLLIQEALLLEMDREPEVSRRVEAHRLNLAQTLYYRAVLPDTFSASEEEIGAFFKEQYRQLRFHTLTVREKSQGDSLREAILNGSSFEELAEQYSLDTRRHRGGDHGFIHWIDIENVFRDRLDTLRPGEISEPFAYREGFSLLRFSDQKPADPSELETYRGNVVGILIYRKKAAANEAYFENLRSKYPVEIDEDLLAELSDISNSKFDAAEGEGLVIAKVGDREVVPADLKYELMRGGSWGDPEAIKNNRQRALEQIIRGELLKLEALTSRYMDEPSVMARTEVLLDSLLLYGYLEEVVSPRVKITPETVEAFYLEHADDFRGASSVNVSQISTDSEEEADVFISRLEEGADFSWLAKKSSLDSYAERGGNYGWAKTSEFPSTMQGDLEAAKPGKILGPYQSMAGYTILRINDRKPGEVLELTTVAEGIERHLYQQEFTRVLNEVLESLRSNSEIVINQGVLDNLVIGGSRNE